MASKLAATSPRASEQSARSGRKSFKQFLTTRQTQKDDDRKAGIAPLHKSAIIQEEKEDEFDLE